MSTEWMDRDAIDRGKAAMRRDSTVGDRTNGPVRQIVGTPQPLTAAQRIKMHKAWAWARKIDSDCQRGGFATHARHAR